MGDRRFWRLTHPRPATRLAEWGEDMGYEEGSICPYDGGHRDPAKRVPSLSVVLPGKVTEDVVWTWFSECMLTDRVLELFRNEALTGFEVRPVKAAFKRSQQPVPRLWELVITGWAGIAPPESGITLLWKCGCGHKKYSGLSNPESLICPSQWDGSDFFMVWPLPKYIFISDRVAQVVRENSITGVVLARPDEIEAKGFTVGRLSDHMPEGRARALGGPLGID